MKCLKRFDLNATRFVKVTKLQVVMEDKYFVVCLRCSKRKRASWGGDSKTVALTVKPIIEQLPRAP